jgi:23S rRNA pseudouridine2605 synthase
MNKERIQKALARQGLGSRRQIESWVVQGEISLNGGLAQLGDHVKAGDVVMHNGRKIIIKEPNLKLPRVIMYHKPEGEVCSRHDPGGRPSMFDKLPGLKHSRWVAVGRLDLNTSGLILLTDNGDLANRLMHPSQQMQREYAVRVLGEVSKDMLKQLTHGVKLEDGLARFEDIVDSGGSGANHWYHVVLMEGRNREVRRMWEAVGVKVSRLMRVRYANVILTKSQRPGQCRELSDRKVIELADMVEMKFDLPTFDAKSHNNKTKTHPRGHSKNQRSRTDHVHKKRR